MGHFGSLKNILHFRYPQVWDFGNGERPYPTDIPTFCEEWGAEASRTLLGTILLFGHSSIPVWICSVRGPTWFNDMFQHRRGSTWDWWPLHALPLAGNHVRTQRVSYPHACDFNYTGVLFPGPQINTLWFCSEIHGKRTTPSCTQIAVQQERPPFCPLAQ